MVLLSIICAAGGAFSFKASLTEEDEVFLTSEYRERQKAIVKARRKTAKRLLVTAIISAVLTVFIPSEKQMYAIYGIGGTIDYIKGNEKAKQLPDKVVDALDKWLDEQKGE